MGWLKKFNINFKKNVERSKANIFSLTSFRESAQQTADDICILRKKKKNYALSGMGMGIRSSPENNHDEQRN